MLGRNLHDACTDQVVQVLSYVDPKADELKARTPGVAANYRSACRSRSRAEFVARIGVASEEADESALWFEILVESDMTCAAAAHRLLHEGDELSAIFARSSLTAQAAARRSPI